MTRLRTLTITPARHCCGSLSSSPCAHAGFCAAQSSARPCLPCKACRSSCALACDKRSSSLQVLYGKSTALANLARSDTKPCCNAHATSLLDDGTPCWALRGQPWASHVPAGQLMSVLLPITTPFVRSRALACANLRRGEVLVREVPFDIPSDHARHGRDFRCLVRSGAAPAVAPAKTNCCSTMPRHSSCLYAADRFAAPHILADVAAALGPASPPSANPAVNSAVAQLVLQKPPYLLEFGTSCH